MPNNSIVMELRLVTVLSYHQALIEPPVIKMKRTFTLVATLLAAFSVSFSLAPSTSADETFKPDCIDECSRVQVDTDLMFLRPHRSDGSSSSFFDYESAPRIRASYETETGAGLRTQYWQFDHGVDTGLNGAATSVDTYNVDFELFKQFDVGCSTKIEFLGGFRYNDYNDLNFGDAGPHTGFDAFGGLIGGQVWHTTGFGVAA